MQESDICNELYQNITWKMHFNGCCKQYRSNDWIALLSKSVYWMTTIY